MFAFANVWKKNYLDNKEIQYIFKTCCIMSVLFYTKCCLFHNFIFFTSKNAFFISHFLKFKYQPTCSKVKLSWHRIFLYLWTELEVLSAYTHTVFLFCSVIIYVICSIFIDSFKADSQIACRAHAVPMPCCALIHTCHATPLPCSDSAVSFMKVRMVAGNI